MHTVLHEIGTRHHTDKADDHHTWRGESYLDIYARHLPPRDFVMNLLEIGVLGGRSLRMWREYYPGSLIYGIDIDPECMKHHDPKNNIFVAIGSQNDRDFLTEVVQNVQPFVVIDDGSHIVSHMLTAFKAIWPHVPSGGIYCIEDLANTHADWHTGRMGMVGRWPGMQLNPDWQDVAAGREPLDAWLKQQMYRLDLGIGDIRSITYEHMMVLIRKA
jgi:hypothetical protein